MNNQIHWLNIGQKTYSHCKSNFISQFYVTEILVFCIFPAAATHVKWNKISRHLLATTHGGDVKIWDERKTSSPVQYVSAHLTCVREY